MSKSEAIRRMIRSNPNMGANDCVKALRKQGIAVNNSLFYNVKASMQACKICHKQSCICTNSVQFQPTINNTVEAINNVKALAGQVGGLKKLSELVEAIR